MPPKKLLFTPDEPVVRAVLLTRLRESVPADYGKKLRSYVGRALDAAGYPADSEDDLRLGLCHLDQRASTREIHADAAAACRKVRDLVLGIAGTKRLTTAAGVVLLPVAWHGLLQYAPAKDRTRFRNRLERLARAVEVCGGLKAAPAQLPSIDELVAVAPKTGLSADSIRKAMSIYRQLRQAAVKSDPANKSRFAFLPDLRRTRGRQVLAVLAERGQQADIEDPLVAIEQVAPTFYKQLSKYTKDPVAGKVRHNDRTVEANLRCAARLVGELMRYAPEVLPTFRIKDLWDQTRRLAAETDESEEWFDDLPVETEVPLARWLIAQLAPGMRERCAPEATSGYNDMIVTDLSHWWSLTEAVLGRTYRERGPLQWMALEKTYRLLRAHVTENPIPKELLVRTKDKETICKLFSMPHVWCVALPVLMREAERFLDRLEAEIVAAKKARPTEDPMRVPAVLAARDQFAESAEGALFTAFVFYDGLRSRQYRFGRWGQHISPDVDIDADTKDWLGIQTRWMGHRGDLARLKQGKSRGRQLGTAHLSFRVLEAYVKHVRASRLIAKGVDPTQALLADGKYPLFISPSGDTPAPYSAEHLRLTTFGPVVYRVATEFLGNKVGDSTSYADVDREALYGVLGIHMARYINATGCFKLLQDPEFAEELTSDERDVLEKDYVSDTWLPEGREGTWRNAKSYLPWLKQMVQAGAMENPLDTMPRELLPPGVLALMDRWEEEDRLLHQRMRKSTYGSPSGRQRRARPDVAERNRQRAAERKAAAEAPKKKVA